ncbi:MAG TPA: hypothetical protein VG602_07905 [Actinomycetota bacterium]|nr:hypothetical protein [Actinomycetota bacterium]
MAQRPGGMDMGRMSTGTKILTIGGLLLFIDLFLPWQGVGGVEAFGIEVPGVNISGFSGLGVFVAILVLGLIVWEALLAFGVNIQMGTTSPALISAILGGAVALFTIILFLTRLTAIKYGAFIGLILALVIAYGAYMRFQESTAGPGPA